MTDLSIVITNYNGESYIDKSIQSVFDCSDDYDKFELVIVDDGSSDNSKEVIENKITESPSNIHCKFIQQENRGTAGARNTGVKESSGTIIGFLDADDVYLKGKIKKSVEAFDIHELVGIVYTDYFSQKSDGSSMYNCKPEYSFDKLMHNCIISTNSFIKKSLFDSIGGFDENVKIIEDYDFWLRSCKLGWYAIKVPEPLFTYSDHDDNKTNSEIKSGGETFMKETVFIKERVSKGENIVLSTK